MPRESSGAGPNPPPGKSLSRFDKEAIADEYNPSRQALYEMLGRPENAFDPNDPDSLFWATGRKFTTELKIQYCQKIAEYGRVNLACIICGVSPSTVARHRERDKRFDESVKLAESYYREATAALIMQQAREGMLERKWNSSGQLISERRTFETQLRIKLLDWCDPSFNSTHKVEATVQGGAVMVPSPVESVDDWARVLASIEAGGNPSAGNYSANMPTTATNTPAVLTADPDMDEDSLDALAAAITTTAEPAAVPSDNSGDE